MADVVCRVCGEGWDCTGGLHPSHMDVEYWQYSQIIHGLGCPCCKGEGHGTTYDNQWFASISALSEGQVQVATDLDRPEFRPGWLTDQWQDQAPPWWWSLGERPAGVEVIDDYDSDAVVYNLDTALPIAEVGDPLLVSNFQALKNEFGPELCCTHPRGGGWCVVVGQLDAATGELLEFNQAWYDRLREIEAQLRDQPVLDEELMSHLEMGDREKEAEEQVQAWSNELDRLFGHSGGIPPSLEQRLVHLLLDQQEMKWDRSEASFRQWLAAVNHQLGPEVGRPAGWRVIQTIEPQCWLVRLEDDRAPWRGGLLFRGDSAEWVEDFPEHHLVRNCWGDFSNDWRSLTLRQKYDLICYLEGE